MYHNIKMTNDKKSIIPKKPSSPFNNDQFNGRGGKGGKRNGVVDGGSRKGKSMNAPKFKGGSGGDR
jgi:hypothetical protein